MLPKFKLVNKPGSLVKVQLKPCDYSSEPTREIFLFVASFQIAARLFLKTHNLYVFTFCFWGRELLRVRW